MKHWYTLHTKPHQELGVTRRLDELDTEAYLPLVWRATRDGTRRQEAFFPCYLFVNLDLEVLSAARWQWIPGLRHFVSFGDVPALVPPNVIELIRGNVERINAESLPARGRFRVGDSVRITHGPMADMEALFERECGPEERACVLLNFLGRTCRVEVDAAYLERSGLGPSPVKERPPRRTRGHGRRIGIDSHMM